MASVETPKSASAFNAPSPLFLPPAQGTDASQIRGRSRNSRPLRFFHSDGLTKPEIDEGPSSGFGHVRPADLVACMFSEDDLPLRTEPQQGMKSTPNSQARNGLIPHDSDCNSEAWAQLQSSALQKQQAAPFEGGAVFPEPLVMTEELAGMVRAKTSSSWSCASGMDSERAVCDFTAKKRSQIGSAMKHSQEIGGAEQCLSKAEQILVQTLELQKQLAHAMNELQSRMDSTHIRMGTFEKLLSMAVGCMSQDQAGCCQDNHHGLPLVPSKLATKADIEDVKRGISAYAGRMEGSHLGFEKLSNRVLELEALAHHLQQYPDNELATPVQQQQQQQQPGQSQMQQQLRANIQSVSGTDSFAQQVVQREPVTRPLATPTSTLMPHVLLAEVSTKAPLMALEAAPTPKAEGKALQNKSVRRLDLQGLQERLAGKVSGIVSSFSTGSLHANAHPMQPEMYKRPRIQSLA